MGRRGFLLAAPGFMIAGVVSGIHLERNRTKVTIAPVNKTVQNAQKFGMDQEHLPPHKKDTIDAITAYRRAQNEIDDLLEQMLKHPSAPIEELKARNDQQHANIVGLSLTSMGIRAGFAGTLMVQAAQLLSIEQKLLGKNHPDFARKHNEMSDLLHGGLFPLLKAETADAALEERIAADEFVDNPVENFQKWTDNLDGLRSHYSFGFNTCDHSQGYNSQFAGRVLMTTLSERAAGFLALREPRQLVEEKKKRQLDLFSRAIACLGVSEMLIAGLDKDETKCYELDKDKAQQVINCLDGSD
ncbi:hypothetical protein BKA80DRAFT_331311 [Phyllosticta citrichinensis]